MLKRLGWAVKICFFAAAVLILGQVFHWRGRTLSDQIRTGLAHAERAEAFKKAKGLASGLREDASEGWNRLQKGARESAPQEDLKASERQRLRALIRELNGSGMEHSAAGMGRGVGAR